MQSANYHCHLKNSVDSYRVIFNKDPGILFRGSRNTLCSDHSISNVYTDFNHATSATAARLDDEDTGSNQRDNAFGPIQTNDGFNTDSSNVDLWESLGSDAMMHRIDSTRV